MPSFQYTATGPDGQIETGTVMGSSMGEAASSLSGRGLRVDSINQADWLNDPLAEQITPPAGPLSATEGIRGEGEGTSSLQTPSSRTNHFEERGSQSPPAEARPYVDANVVGALVGRVSPEQLMFFFRQFGTMMNAGVP